MLEFDPHIHSVASGHGEPSTITDLARQAASQGLKMIGITDHGPATRHSAKESYFRSLPLCERAKFGVEILYGVELNILTFDGKVDLDDSILNNLDYAIASLHRPVIKPGTIEENTRAYISAMHHPKVRIIGHCDDVKYPADYPALLETAMRCRVLLEINNSSLDPHGYRGDTRHNIQTILNLCRRYNYPVVLSSDSHTLASVGNFSCALEEISRISFPRHLILNYSCERFKTFLNHHKI